MGLLILADADQSVVLWVLLLPLLGLTFWETRTQRLEWKQTVWWLLLVLLTHVPGYLALWVWGIYRRWSRRT